jgi:hypothetical protein
MFVVILAIPLVAVKPMQEGVGKRCMHSATGAEFVESVGRVWVHLEERLNIEQFGGSWLCQVLKKTVLEVGSGEGAYLKGRLLLSVVALSFHQWERKWGMMSLRP